MKQEVNEVDYSHLYSITECSLAAVFISASMMSSFCMKKAREISASAFELLTRWFTAAVIDEHVVINAVLSSIQQYHITVPDLNVLKPM